MLILKRDYRGLLSQYVRKDFDDYLGVRGVLERKLPFFLTDLAFEAVSGPSMLSGTKSDRTPLGKGALTRFENSG